MTAETTDTSYIWPARHEAGARSDPNLPPMGARFRLKASFDISGFSPQAQVVLRAMQQYGLILADNGSNWYFGGTADPAWPLALVDELKQIPASEFEAVDESSLMVSPDSGQARQFPGPVTGIAAPPSGSGYWLSDAEGAVSAHNVPNHGSMAGTLLNAPISHIVSTPDGGGYWLVAADGGTFSFGDAAFYGSMGGKPLNAPVVNMAATPDGRGYWLVASDGGVFAFGDAPFFGSMGGTTPERADRRHGGRSQTGGYWLVASDGGIFSFGAPFFGSTGAIHLQTTGQRDGACRAAAVATGWSPPTAGSSRSALHRSGAAPAPCNWWRRSWAWRRMTPPAATGSWLPTAACSRTTRPSSARTEPK